MLSECFYMKIFIGTSLAIDKRQMTVAVDRKRNQNGG